MYPLVYTGTWYVVCNIVVLSVVSLLSTLEPWGSSIGQTLGKRQ